ncbi:histidine phosphatase family protein [Pseudomonas chlororaphis]|uniref:histidine phosphatase family protein n=1 Tax=Pseudomonas chlororaphis TaxID=587753 RepID=UPI0006A56FB6|nr:histidine phosphatase family protein [Pseudomonas chlororaphis]AZD01478.1 putative phosphoglycerate mutase [Pseudomonas chlororaphis subsp. chlororaphis]MBM0285160.1 histidine phosphatase family protein [Pseudomonas chlororaphis]MDO1505832.1 histidine phosphatase family protein [Pseudomonas chlororaphis]ORM49708.1 phosphoglycerate mutase [Pseudomonas chlororaphis subsp. chlororaphis]TWR98986.1 histidine phosphatase family protein [Pseudomonas chlororaphis subsp. chlororaphis]
MPATRLTLICHARTVAQKLARFPLDEPLEMDWQALAGSRAGAFKGLPRLLSAPEQRARQTAALYGAAVETVAALRDCDMGRWQGLSIDSLQREQPEAVQAWLADSQLAPHGGESVAQLCERVAAWLASLCEQPGHVLAVTHPLVIRAALVHVMQCPLASFNAIDVEPLAQVELRFNGRWRLRLDRRD